MGTICKYCLKLLSLINNSMYYNLFFRNVSEPLSRDEPATNNVAEIRAVIKALQIVKQFGCILHTKIL